MSIHLKQFLRGGKRDLIRELSGQMERAAQKLEFEQAAAIRDQIQAVRQVHHLARMESLRDDLIHPDIGEGLKLIRKHLGLRELPRLIDGIDAAAVSGKEAVGSAVVFADGEPHKASYRHYRIKSARTLDDPAMIGMVFGMENQWVKLSQDALAAFLDIVGFDPALAADFPDGIYIQMVYVGWSPPPP